MPRVTALYVRFTTKRRDAPGQVPELRRWVGGHVTPVRWYGDYYTGSGRFRPGLDQLRADVRARRLGRVVIWRLDRLGLTAKGLSTFFDVLRQSGVNLISLSEGLDLSTPEGRRTVRLMASLGAYEKEERSTAILAGQEVARARGGRWGGSAKGRRWAVTAEQEWAAQRLHEEGHGVTAVARATGLTRATVYRILGESGFRPRRRAGAPRSQATG